MDQIAPVLRPGEPPSVAVSANTIDVSADRPPDPDSNFYLRKRWLTNGLVFHQTVAYLLKLPEHQETIENFLTQLGDRKWLMGGATSTAAGDDNDEGVLEHFVFDVAAALMGALESRAKGMRKGVGAIFLVNNGQSVLLGPPMAPLLTRFGTISRRFSRIRARQPPALELVRLGPARGLWGEPPQQVVPLGKGYVHPPQSAIPPQPHH